MKRTAVFLLVSTAVLVFLGNFGKLYLSLENRLTKAIEVRKLATHPVNSPNPVPKKNLTRIVLLGDSMTERLGNSEILARYLSVYYPDRRFLLLNYGYGSTNILSAQERFDRTTYHGREFQPIKNIDFDCIVIESFGNNPLSGYPLKVAESLQYSALDKLVSSIRATHPNAKIIFLATIAPNRENYAKPEVGLSPSERQSWVDERSLFIRSHIAYARAHNIPVIDVYDRSTNFFGDGDNDYIASKDQIHPSPKGIFLISEELATGLYKLGIFAK